MVHIVNGLTFGAAVFALLGVVLLVSGITSSANAEEPEKDVKCKIICGNSDEEIPPECAEFLMEFTDAEGNIDCDAIIEKYTDEEGNFDCDALLGELSGECCPGGKKTMKIMICKPSEEEEG